MTPAPDSSDEARTAPPDQQPVLVIPTAIRDEIRERARGGSPAEICGVLGGEFGTKKSRVDSQYPAENVADSPRTRYRIDPEEQLEVFERLEAGGEEIVGFYHSHPRGPDQPSETDARQATWPDRSYLIVSLEPPAVGSWRWRTGDGRDESVASTGGQFERERLVLE
ncbi:M67 family metallopeptidase [Natronolimnobius sp. AArcel1]|uniref:desampylase n=1 Tax=Natronolimnobius sp. AArcel1 TaxID=1679093 RepID=UPI0013ED6EC3|nr:M67 family metallopeptidase [Natronolimnobius sp. AArcel1]